MRTTKTQPIARSATDSPVAHDFLDVDVLVVGQALTSIPAFR